MQKIILETLRDDITDSPYYSGMSMRKLSYKVGVKYGGIITKKDLLAGYEEKTTEAIKQIEDSHDTPGWEDKTSNILALGQLRTYFLRRKLRHGRGIWLIDKFRASLSRSLRNLESKGLIAMEGDVSPLCVHMNRVKLIEKGME